MIYPRKNPWKQKKANDRWTDDELQALLSISVEDDIQQKLKTVTRNEKVYTKATFTKEQPY